MLGTFKHTSEGDRKCDEAAKILRFSTCRTDKPNYCQKEYQAGTTRQNQQSLAQRCALCRFQTKSFFRQTAKTLNQIGWMPRLIWVFTGLIGHFWFCRAPAQIILEASASEFSSYYATANIQLCRGFLLNMKHSSYQTFIWSWCSQHDVSLLLKSCITIYYYEIMSQWYFVITWHVYWPILKDSKC